MGTKCTYVKTYTDSIPDDMIYDLFMLSGWSKV